MRFIPTVVGNTARLAAYFVGRSVHPHGRGEHIVLFAGQALQLGSSPRSWGTRSARERRRGNQRFIPTVVGNTRGR